MENQDTTAARIPSQPPNAPESANSQVSVHSKANWILFFTLAIAGCSIDLGTKSWIFARLGFPNYSVGQKIVLVPRVFSLTTSLNEGALFGMGQGFALGFAAFSFVALTGILVWLSKYHAIRDRCLVVSLGLIVSGIFGNLYDRLGFHQLVWQGNMHLERAGQRVYAVRDWLHFRLEREDGSSFFDFAVFNLADSFLVCGASLIFLLSFRKESSSTQKD
jgi:signal peptidase II